LARRLFHWLIMVLKCMVLNGCQNER
jgi:hypothetical protein